MYEDPEEALRAIEGLVEQIALAAAELPLVERTGYIAERLSHIRQVYAEHFADDPEGLSHAAEFANHVEGWAHLRLAQLEAEAGGSRLA